MTSGEKNLVKLIVIEAKTVIYHFKEKNSYTTL